MRRRAPIVLLTVLGLTAAAGLVRLSSVDIASPADRAPMHAYADAPDLDGADDVGAPALVAVLALLTLLGLTQRWGRVADLGLTTVSLGATRWKAARAPPTR